MLICDVFAHCYSLVGVVGVVADVVGPDVGILYIFLEVESVLEVGVCELVCFEAGL